MALTPRQQRFVEEYLVDLNATQAAIRAGYSRQTARFIGHENLTKPNVAEAIAAAQAARSARTEITADNVLRELALIGFSDIGQVLDFTGDQPRLRRACEIPERARRAIGSVKVRRYVEGHGDQAREVEVVEFKLWPKDPALDKLGKHLDLYKDRVEHSGPGGGPIPHEHHNRESLTAADLDEADRLARLAGVGVSPDGGAQPVDPEGAPPSAAPLPGPG